MKKLQMMLFLQLLVLFLFSQCAFAADGVNWDKGVVTAIGYGALPNRTVQAGQATILARRAAIVDAYRNLAETIEGVQVDSETTVKNLVITDDTIKTKVNAFIKGAKVTVEKQLPNGIYMVTMQINLYGEQGLSQIVYQTQPSSKKPPEVTPLLPTTDRPIASSGTTYTGLVVDATGLPVERCMAPKIFDETGREIYGTMDVSFDYLSEVGILGYASTPEMLQKVALGTARTGSKPLTVKAIKVQNHGYNIVVSKADGERILAANQKDGFLQKCAVIVKK